MEKKLGWGRLTIKFNLLMGVWVPGESELVWKQNNNLWANMAPLICCIAKEAMYFVHHLSMRKARHCAHMSAGGSAAQIWHPLKFVSELHTSNLAIASCHLTIQAQWPFGPMPNASPCKALREDDELEAFVEYEEVEERLGRGRSYIGCSSVASKPLQW